MKVKREKFQSELKSTWKIADPNAREAILNDPNRSEQAKEEDLAFFDDYFGENAERKWVMDGRDKDYDRELLSSLLSAEAKENRKQERERIEAARTAKEKEQSVSRYARVSLEEEHDDNDDDLGDTGQDVEDIDWATGQTEEKGARRSRQRKRKSGDGGDSGGSDEDDDDDNGVWVKVPRDILKLTAPTAVRKGLSHGDHVTLLASFL